jgi:hypothetical protein
MKQKQNDPEILELDRQAADEIVRRLEASNLPEPDRQIIRGLFASYLYVVQLLQLKRISIARLKKFIFGGRTEKTAAVVGSVAPTGDSAPGGQGGSGEGGPEEGGPEEGGSEEGGPGDAEAAPAGTAEAGSSNAPPKRRKGHGRHGVNDFPGAERIVVPHPSLQAGDDCPHCAQSPVYVWVRPATVIRFAAQMPVQAKIYERQQLRCHLCGKLFTAPLPEDAGREKYDPSVGILIALLKYGRGLPFNRLSELHASVGIPLPPGTQWKLVEELADILRPIYEELVRQAAQGDVLYHDDTVNRILSLMGKRRAATLAAQESSGGKEPAPVGGEAPPLGAEAASVGAEAASVGAEAASVGKPSLDPKRTGIFTSGIVSTWEGHQAVIFFTGRQHAGENLRDVLGFRNKERELPIQMCDPLSRNMPADLATILANCLAHGRRQFADVAEYFPQECSYVLHALKKVYKNDELARRDELSPEERLKFHQTHSKPVMEDLQKWLQRQFAERRVEPNSALGGAISYLLRHWDPFTLFLRKAGAPLDNNLCERALKKVILHRKNSLFYKTENGAGIGDLFTSLIHTCELGGFNPLDYFHQLVRHQGALARNPAAWLPWNYRQTVESLGNSRPPPTAAALES